MANNKLIKEKILNIALLSSIVFSFSFHAQANESLINRIQTLSKELAKVNHADSKCNLDATSFRCDFDSQCDQLKASDLYAYTDSQGYTIPNGPLVTVMAALDVCSNSKTISSQIKDPFLYLNQFYDEKAAGGAKQLADNKALLSKETKRAEAVFRESMSKITKVLESRRNSQNSKSIDNLLGRLKDLKFVVQSPNTSQKDLFEQGCEFANAAYQPFKHTVLMCPQMLNMPESTLFFVLAHEIGHAIGPCNSSYDYSQGAMSIPEWILPGFESSAIKQPRIPSKDHPLKSVFQCLQTDKSINVKLPKKSEIIARVEQEKKEAIASKLNFDEEASTEVLSMVYDEKIAQINSNYDEYSSCYELSGSSHLEESSADWYASQAVSLKLAELQSSSQKKEFAFGASGAMMSLNGCANTRQAAIQKAKAIVGNEKCDQGNAVINFLQTSNEQDGKEHPLAANRINKVLLAQPDLRSALQCKGAESVQQCK